MIQWVSLLLLIGLLSACAAEGSETKTIKIGYQKTTDALLLKESEALAEELKERGYTVTWSEFNTGSSIIEALNSGSIDFANVGDMPALFALAKGMAFKIIGSHEDAPLTEGIVAAKESGITDLADLDGKKVAYNKASIAEYLTIKALDSVDLTVEDIDPVHLNPPDASIALEKGEIDAWVVWDPYMTVAAESGHEVIQTAEGLTRYSGFQLATEEMTENHPEIVEVVIHHLNEIGKALNEDPTEGATVMEDVTGVPENIWEISISNKEWGLLHLDDRVIKSVEEQADDLLRVGLIDDPINFDNIFWTKTDE